LARRREFKKSFPTNLAVGPTFFGGFGIARTGLKCQLPKNRMWSLLKEFLQFIRQEKKWWLIPLIVLLLLLGAVLIFTASSGIAWALYPFL
jgi:hypothetical protein